MRWEISEEIQAVLAVLGIGFLLGAFAFVLDHLSPNDPLHEKVACAKCEAQLERGHMLLLHVKFEGQALNVPYCPECVAMLLNKPDVLTWAGAEAEADKK